MSCSYSKILLVILGLASFTALGKPAPKVIYGEDNRIDSDKTPNTLFAQLSESTAAMIDASSLQVIEGNRTKVLGSTLAQDMRVCAEERFSDQMSVAMCSGFLVGPDLLVTAGHCITDANDCAQYKWVFDYNQGTLEANGKTILSSDVYGCKEIISRELSRETMSDYALIRLDRVVSDRTPLEIRKEGKVSDNTALVVIGHPSGLPTKVADGANVRSNDQTTYFEANLDTYGGNSGSAVFDANTGMVEGILVRGETDYIMDYERGCRKSKLCTNEGCSGEDVTRITEIPFTSLALEGKL